MTKGGPVDDFLPPSSTSSAKTNEVHVDDFLSLRVRVSVQDVYVPLGAPSLWSYSRSNVRCLFHEYNGY